MTAHGWESDEFIPVSSVRQVWNGSGQVSPYDNTRRLDLAPMLDQLGIEGAHVFKKFLSVRASDTEQRFGTRLGANG